MKTSYLFLYALFTAAIFTVPLTAPADEAATLAGINKKLGEAEQAADDTRQKLSLRNARSALSAAEEALQNNDEDEAKKNKKKALKWVVQAVRECMKPGDTPGELGEALRNEGALSENGLKRFNELLDNLVSAKERKKKSDFPFGDGLVLNQLILALFEIIDSGGHDGWHPGKALDIYINMAASCEDVQKEIDKLLDYLARNADDTGIPDISPEARDKAKKMVDELYTMKAEGAPLEDILDMADKIKNFLDEQGRITGQKRKAKIMSEDEEEEAEEETADEQLLAPRPVTTVVFTALEGETNVNNHLLGEVESIRFLAIDGKEIEPREVEPDYDPHGDSSTIDIGKVGRLGGVIITGTDGTIRLLHGGAVEAPPAAKTIAPRDGIIDVRNGTVNETLDVPDTATEMVGDPQSHTVMIADQPVTVVATRPGQVAVSGSGITPPRAGTATVEITTPSGQVVTDTAPAWGYDITMPEVTKTDTVVPIMAQVYGLEPTDRVIFHFIPEPGQQIQPQERIATAAELLAPAPIAEISVDKPGPQALNVTVTLEED